MYKIFTSWISLSNTNSTAAAQDYFDYTMELADSRFDESYGYIWWVVA